MPSSRVPDGACPEIEPVSRSGIEALLQAGEFEAIDAQVYAQLDAYKLNPLCEPRLLGAWEVLGWMHEDEPEALDAWVEASTRPAAALTARGYAYTDLGYEARGTKWARDTPAENFARMRELHGKARADLERAVELAPESPIALKNLAWITKAGGGDRERLLALLDAHLKHDPLTLTAREGVMDAFEPKWGGSLDVMHRIAEEAQAYSDRNPRLVPLQGRPYAYLAGQAWGKKNYADAHAYYTKALSYGDWGAQWSVYRSKIRRYLHDYPGALIDAERAVKTVPTSDECWDALGYALRELDRFDEAAEAWTKAIEINDDYLWYYERRGVAYDGSNRFEEALADFRKSAELDPTRHYPWSMVGYLLAEDLDRFDEAIPALERAAEIKPEFPGNWFLLGLSHEKLGDLEKARGYYDHYLKLEATAEKPVERRIRFAMAFDSRQTRTARAEGAPSADRLPGLSGLTGEAQ
jgi:tetratricopeptide (TPR) repeat protein